MLLTLTRSTGTDPFLPVQWELMQTAVAFVGIPLLVAAVISIFRTKDHPLSIKILWVMIVFVLPIIGPIFWFVGGRKTSK